MTPLTLESIAAAANRAATAHRPKGFSASAEILDGGRIRVVVRYCWRDSPRFDILSETVVVAQEAAEAVGALGALPSTVDYLDDHICCFDVVLPPGAATATE